MMNVTFLKWTNNCQGPLQKQADCLTSNKPYQISRLPQPQFRILKTDMFKDKEIT